MAVAWKNKKVKYTRAHISIRNANFPSAPPGWLCTFPAGVNSDAKGESGEQSYPERVAALDKHCPTSLGVFSQSWQKSRWNTCIYAGNDRDVAETGGRCLDTCTCTCRVSLYVRVAVATSPSSVERLLRLPRTRLLPADLTTPLGPIVISFTKKTESFFASRLRQRRRRVRDYIGTISFHRNSSASEVLRIPSNVMFQQPLPHL